MKFVVVSLVLVCIAVAVPVEESPKAKVVEAAPKAKVVEVAPKAKAAVEADTKVKAKAAVPIKDVVPVKPMSEEEIKEIEKTVNVVEKEGSAKEDAAAGDESNTAVNLAATGASQTSASFRFESGRLQILVGRDEVVETTIPNPVMFVSPVLIGPNTAEHNPALVSRVKREDLGEETDTSGAVIRKYRFLVTAAVEPCTTQDSEEQVDYFIVSAHQADTLGDDGKAYVAETSSDASNNRFWVFTADVNLNRGMTAGQLFRFGHATVGRKQWQKAQHNEQYHLTGTAHCLTQIQTRNQEGYLQSNSHEYNNQATYLRARGTYNEGIRNEGGRMVNEASSQTETVAAFCIADPGDNTPLTLQLGEMNLRFEIVKSLRGPGMLNVVPGEGRTKVVVGGQMAGKNPYHIRAWDIINSNGVHMFKIEEDKCSNPHTRHTEERVLTAAFA